MLDKPSPACRCGRLQPYKVRTAPDGRPEFICHVCDRSWTCGHDGGPYTAYAIARGWLSPGVEFRTPSGVIRAGEACADTSVKEAT